MNPPHLSLPVLLLALALAGCKPVETQQSVTSHMTYHTTKELVGASDVILTGTVQDTFEEAEHHTKRFKDGDMYDFYTLRKIQVDRVLKNTGGRPIQVGDTVEVTEPASLVEEKYRFLKLVRDDYQILQKGARYLLFTKKNDLGGLFILNRNAGRYNLDGQDERDMVFTQENAPAEVSLDQKKVKQKQELRDELFRTFSLNLQ